MLHPSMRGQTMWRLRNNPLYVGLFEQSSQSPTTTESSSIVEPVEIAQNGKGNASKHLSDFARPILQRPFTRINAPFNRGANFRIDSHVMSMLLIFHGKTFEYRYRHVDELSHVCEINQIHNIPSDVLKMKLFPTTFRDQAKDWF